MSLEQVFSETDETEEATQEVDELNEEGTEEESTVDDDAATTVAEQDEAKDKSDGRIPIAALLDERQKRQKLEEKLAELEAKLTKPQEEDDTDYIPQSELKKRIDSEVDAKVKQALFQANLKRTYEQTKEKYPDFAEKEAAFAEIAKADPKIRARFLESENPAEFAYIQATNHLILSKYDGNVMAAFEALKKEQGIEVQEKKEPASKKSRTPSLANATESEKTSAPVEKASTLDDIFEDYAL